MTQEAKTIEKNPKDVAISPSTELPKSLVEKKLRAPRIREVDPLFFTIYGYFSKCFAIAPSELTRLLKRYSLSMTSLQMLLSKNVSHPLRNTLSMRLLSLVGDLNIYSKTSESQTLFNLVHRHLNRSNSLGPTDPLSSAEGLHDSLEAGRMIPALSQDTPKLVPEKSIVDLHQYEAFYPSDDTTSLSVAKKVSDDKAKTIVLTRVTRPTVEVTPKSPEDPLKSSRTSIPLVPALSPILKKVFGQELIDDREIAALVTLTYQKGFDVDNIEYMTKILSPMMQVGLVGFLALFLVRKGHKEQVLNFLEGNLRELSVTEHDKYQSVYTFLSRSANITLKTAHGPLGFFSYDQLQKLTSLSSTLEVSVAGVYFSTLLTQFMHSSHYYSHPNLDHPIPSIEILVLLLSLLVNIDFGLPKQVVWGDFIQGLTDLTSPAPRVSDVCVEATQQP